MMYTFYETYTAKRGDICLIPYRGDVILCEYWGVLDPYGIAKELQTGDLWPVRNGQLLKIVSRL